MRDTADHVHGVEDAGGECAGDVVSMNDVHNLGFAHVSGDNTHARNLAGSDILAAFDNDSSDFKMANAKHVPITWKFRDTYTDEYMAEELPSAQTRAAIIDEMKYVNDVVRAGMGDPSNLVDCA